MAEDPHLWGTALFDEVTAMGYDRSYPSSTGRCGYAERPAGSFLLAATTANTFSKP